MAKRSGARVQVWLKQTPIPNVDDRLSCWDLWEHSAALAPSPVMMGCTQSWAPSKRLRAAGCTWDGSSGRTQGEEFLLLPQNPRTWERTCPLLGSRGEGHLGESLAAEFGTFVWGLYWVFSKLDRVSIWLFYFFFFFSPEIAKGTHLTSKPDH